MRSAPWLEVAIRELVAGVAELPGADHNLRIVEYHRATSLEASDDETPWCSAFVNWCLRQAWIDGTRSAMARSFTAWGNASALEPGAVCVLWRDSPTSSSGHVGFFLGQSAAFVYLLGGNQGNRVSVAAFPTSRVIGTRWPA